MMAIAIKLLRNGIYGSSKLVTFIKLLLRSLTICQSGTIRNPDLRELRELSNKAANTWAILAFLVTYLITKLTLSNSRIFIFLNIYNDNKSRKIITKYRGTALL